MKKFKHIPTGRTYTKALGSMFYRFEDSNSDHVPAFIVESGEDWKEVKKPEWTILSFKVKDLLPSGILTLDTTDNKYKIASWQYSLEFLLSNPIHNTIHSVRRESDGEVFTVDDDVNVGGGVCGKLKVIDFMIKSQPSLHVIDNEEQKWTHVLSNCTKVKPKEWEITVFRGVVEKAYLYFLMKDNMYALNVDGSSFTFNQMLDGVKNNLCVIDKVKRLSDGVEFKIGDNIKSLKGNWKGLNTIAGFVLDGMQVLIAGENYDCGEELAHIEKEEELQLIKLTEKQYKKLLEMLK